MIGCMCRIPVYDKDPALNIVGLLYVKDLVLLNPDDEFKIKDILHFYNHVPVTLQVSSATSAACSGYAQLWLRLL